MNHDELRELVPIYALDALDGDEELEVRSHVETCEACRLLLDAHVQAAAGLALAADPVAAPAALRSRLMTAVASTPQSSPVPPPVPDLGLRRSMTWQRVSAIVGVAALVVLGAFSYRQTRHLHEQERKLAAQGKIFQALASPLATAVPLTGTGPGVNASAELYVSGDKHTAGLVARGLSDPGEDVYQLWLIVDNVPAPVEAFRPDPSGLALLQIRTNLSEMQGMAVTMEARAGNPAPKGPYVLKS
jgi:Anti-sigma-K factor rskA, C-terminal/Putative zinc-finger